MASNCIDDLTAQNLAVFPLGEDKAPACPHGFKDATSDLVAAHALFARFPGPLIGIATGAVSGIDALDIDAKPGGRQWWAEHRHRLPETRVHRTRSGGLHCIFRHAIGLRNSGGRIHSGVDTRADGGYIVFWPGAGLPVLCDAPPAPWPEWLLSQALPPPLPVSRVAVVSDYKLIRGILTVVARAAEGQRNHALYWAACRFAESTLARAEADELLINAALQVGLPIAEARATINSAYRRRACGA